MPESQLEPQFNPRLGTISGIYRFLAVELTRARTLAIAVRSQKAIGLGNSSDLWAVHEVWPDRNRIAVNHKCTGKNNLSLLQECQPDLAFYTGAEFTFPPKTSAPVDVNQYGPPTLVIEISASSLNDDLGHKRLLYERLGVREYWVADVEQSKVIAFEVSEGRSGQIRKSKVLPGLLMDVVEEALRRSQTEDDGTVNRWLLQTFTPSV
jgi:Putative restriction endonuclease